MALRNLANKWYCIIDIQSSLLKNRISMKKNQVLLGYSAKELFKHCGPLLVICFPLSVGLQHPPHRSVYWAGGPRQGNTLPWWHNRDGLIWHPTEHCFYPSALWGVSMAVSVKKKKITKIFVIELWQSLRNTNDQAVKIKSLAKTHGLLIVIDQRGRKVVMWRLDLTYTIKNTIKYNTVRY